MSQVVLVGNKDGETTFAPLAADDLPDVSPSSLPVATSAALGAVQPDGTVITVSGAGAITVAKASAAAFGVAKVDGTTITAASGVLTAPGLATAFPATTGKPSTTPAAGTAMFDASADKLWIYDGSAWKGVALTLTS